MSRTYRKHAESFEANHSWLIQEIYSGRTRWFNRYLTDEEIEQSKKDLEVLRYKYKTQTRKYYDYGLPREFRNSVNRTRRARDRHEVWKATNWREYEEQCSKWNCKDSNSWDFW